VAVLSQLPPVTGVSDMLWVGTTSSAAGCVTSETPSFTVRVTCRFAAVLSVLLTV